MQQGTGGLPPGSGGFLNPQHILKEFDIRAGMSVADFGSGSGYFSIPLAQAVGNKGAVYAIDVQKSALEAVRSRARFLGILLIRTIRGNLEKEHGSTLEDSSVHRVLCVNILFQTRDRGAVIREAKRVLRTNGKLIIIEWRKNGPWGPSPDLRLAEEELIQLAETEGFELKNKFEAGQHHIGLVFKL